MVEKKYEAYLLCFIDHINLLTFQSTWRGHVIAHCAVSILLCQQYVLRQRIHIICALYNYIHVHVYIYICIYIYTMVESTSKAPVVVIWYIHLLGGSISGRFNNSKRSISQHSLERGHASLHGYILLWENKRQPHALTANVQERGLAITATTSPLPTRESQLR